MKSLWLIGLVTLVGAYLRFSDLGVRPLWVDEVIFANMVRGVAYQEYPAVWLVQLSGATTEYGLRFLFALCGTLTVPAIWWVLRRNIWAGAIVAVFPLFVFWSRMARPYAFIGLIVVLSWRYWWLMFLGVVTSPLALTGIKLTHKWWTLAIFGFLAVGMFFLRPDAGRDWSLSMLQYHSRFWYVPCLALVLYYFDYLESRLLTPSPSRDT